MDNENVPYEKMRLLRWARRASRVYAIARGYQLIDSTETLSGMVIASYRTPDKRSVRVSQIHFEDPGNDRAEVVYRGKRAIAWITKDIYKTNNTWIVCFTDHFPQMLVRNANEIIFYPGTNRT